MVRNPKINYFTFQGKPFQPSIIDKDEALNKRYLLKIEFPDNPAGVDWLVILKNPSKAGLTNVLESDMTINAVCSYFARQRQKVRQVTITNLFPLYLTDSTMLRDHKDVLVDNRNINIIKQEISMSAKIVLAWGASPRGCQKEFQQMKEVVFNILDKKLWYQMKRRTAKLNLNRPLHGQVWRKDCNLVLIK